MRLMIFALLLVFSVPAFAAEKESVYDRVIRTNTIRCGYYVWPPFIAKDPNTGIMSGIGYDMMEEIGKQLSLKVEWTAEVNFDALLEGYASNRYDMVCGPMTATPAWARASDFTIPFVYAAYYLYAKEGDKRFDNNYAKVNDPKVRYAALEGDMNAILGNEEFPLAQKVSLAQITSNVDVLMSVAAGKADVTTMEPVPSNGFMKANPGKIRQVPGPAVRAMPLNYSVPPGEEKFKAMINITLKQMIDTGFIDKMLKKYPDYDATVLRLSPGYGAPAKK